MYDVCAVGVWDETVSLQEELMQVIFEEDFIYCIFKKKKGMINNK